MDYTLNFKHEYKNIRRCALPNRNQYHFVTARQNIGNYTSTEKEYKFIVIEFSVFEDYINLIIYTTS